MHPMWYHWCALLGGLVVALAATFIAVVLVWEAARVARRWFVLARRQRRGGA
jgi:hypothetical protein